MAWADNAPNHDIPQATRDFVWTRDGGECQLRYPGVCVIDAEEIDHIAGVAELGYVDSDPENLRLVCQPCHKLRTQQQRWPTFGRQPERHPGIRR